jgi:hypothetical protein
MKKKLILKCDFTDEEINDIAKEMAEQLSEKTRIDLEKKEVVKKYTREISYYDKKINESGIKIQNGYEEREVQCEIKMNTPKAGIKTITRLDNKDTWEEPMNLNDHDLFSLNDINVDGDDN